MEPYVPREGDRVFVPFGEAHDRAGERGTVSYFGPKESPDELKRMFEESPDAPKPVEYPAVLFDEEKDPEWLDRSRIAPYTFRAYLASYLSHAMRSVRIWPLFWRLAALAVIPATVWYGWAHRADAPAAAPQAQADEIMKLGKLEAEAVLRRAVLLHAQRGIKIELEANVTAVKAEDAKIAQYRAAALRAVNAPQEKKTQP